MPKNVESEIPIEEFRTLGEVFEKARVKEEEVLDLIRDKALSTNAIAKGLGLSYSATYSRLQRLLEKEKVIKRGKDGNAFWLSAESM